MLRTGEIIGARKCLENPDVERTTSVENLMSLAHVHQLLGEHRKSLAFMDKAKAQGHDNADFRYFRGLQLQFNGRLEEAEAEMESCIRMGPTYGRAVLSLARIRKQTAASNHLAYIREQIQVMKKGPKTMLPSNLPSTRNWRISENTKVPGKRSSAPMPSCMSGCSIKYKKKKRFSMT